MSSDSLAGASAAALLMGEARLTSYLAPCDGDLDLAMGLNRRNLQLAQAVLRDVTLFEVDVFKNVFLHLRIFKLPISERLIDIKFGVNTLLQILSVALIGRRISDCPSGFKPLCDDGHRFVICIICAFRRALR